MINGDITILVAGTEILSLRINLVIASIETAKRYGIELPWEKWQSKQELEKYNDKNQVKTLNENGKKLGRQARSKGEKNWEDAKNWVDKQYQKKKKIGKMQRIG